MKDDISRFLNNSDIQILALVNKTGEGTIDGHVVISKDRIYEFDYDNLLICADGEMAISIF